MKLSLASAALFGATAAIRLSTEADKKSADQMLFATFTAQNNKNYTNLVEMNDRKEIFLANHEKLLHLHPATSFVADNFLSDQTPEEL